MANLEETAAFVVHAIKQFCFGFEKMAETSNSYADASPAKSFYLTAIYQHIAIFYLLDRGKKEMGGAFFHALVPHGLGPLLDAVREILATRLGQTTFGEIVRTFRNRVIVHPKFGDAGLDRIYDQVDMEEPEVQSLFQELLERTYIETRTLALRLAESTGRPPSDFGIKENPAE